MRVCRSEQHLALTDVFQKFGRGLNVMGLGRCYDKLLWQTIIIGQSMDFCSKTFPASSKTAIWVAFLK